MARPSERDPQHIPLSKTLLIAYLYFIQGVFLNIPSTLTLTYHKMPAFRILGLFSMALLPFSFKFVTAPLIEKYSSVTYGRRKAWLVLSLLSAGCLLLCATGFTQTPEDQAALAILMTAVIFLVSIEDICTDGLAIKELRSPEKASYLQLVWQLVGGVFGSLFFLELVSADSVLGHFGLITPIITVPQFLIAVSITTMSSGFLIHCFYTETTLNEEKDNNHTLLQVIKHYVYFINPRYRMCRQALTNLFAVHGLFYFISSYPIQLINMQAISKQNLTAVSNIMIVPVIAVTHIISRCHTQSEELHKRIRIVLALRLTVTAGAFFLDIREKKSALLAICIMQLLSNVHFFFNSMIANQLSDSKFAGMYVTMMASSINLGNNPTLQLSLIDTFGYEQCSVFGFVYTAVVVLLFGRIEAWIKAAENCEPVHSVSITHQLLALNVEGDSSLIDLVDPAPDPLPNK